MKPAIFFGVLVIGIVVLFVLHVLGTRIVG